MKKHTLQTCSAALLLLLLAQTAAGCTSGTTDEGTAANDTTPVTEAVTEDPAIAAKEAYFAALPAISAPGTEIMFAAINTGSEGMAPNEISTEEENGAKMNDAVYRREIEIEECLGVSIACTPFDESDALSTALNNSVLSGEGTFDVVSAKRTLIPGAFSNGYLQNMNTVPHLQMDKAWWNQSANEAFTLAGVQIAAISSLNHYANQVAWYVMFNKTLFDNYDLEYPYQTVRDGNWTLDALHELVKTVPTDSNGDGAIDHTDIFGCINESFDAIALTQSFGCDIMAINSDGIPELVLDKEENLNRLAAITEFFNDTAHVMVCENYRGSVEGSVYAMRTNKFINGEGLFMFNCPANIYKFADMENDYGVLPLPKYDSTQDGYYTLTSNAHTTLLAIPRVHGADDGDIGLVVDAMSYLSYVDVEPMYAETYLENRYLRDEDSVEMLNIVIQNKTYDAAFLLNYGNANSLPQECSSGRGDKIASTIESKRKAVEKEVQKALQSAEDMKQ